MSEAPDSPYVVRANVHLTNRSLLTIGQHVQAPGWGASMSPFILQDDIVNLEPLMEKKARLGDVLAFHAPGSETLVVHRVVAVRRSACLMQGDNTGGKPDGWVSMDRAAGRVIFVERNGRRVRLGLGPERVVIALLSRSRLLLPLLRSAAAVFHWWKRLWSYR